MAREALRAAGGAVDRTAGKSRFALQGWARDIVRLFPVILAAASAAASGPTNRANPAERGPPPQAPPSADELAAARGLESLLADQMIQEMRKTVPENELVPLTQGERIYRQMLDSEYARILSETGSLGVADLVVAQIRGRR